MTFRSSDSGDSQRSSFPALPAPSGHTDMPHGPPVGMPPRYGTMLQRWYSYSLRPVLIFTSTIGCIWAVVMGVSSIRSRVASGAGPMQARYYLITEIMYFVVCGVEAIGVLVALVQSVALARFYCILVAFGILVTFVAQLITVIIHFTLKDVMISQCISNMPYQPHSPPYMSPDATRLACNYAWVRGSWTVFAWLIVSAIASLVFGLITYSYYRQLVDPSSVRQRQPFSQRQPFFQWQNQQSWAPPQYPGRPSDASMPPLFEKADYHSDEEGAAQYSLPYASSSAGDSPSSTKLFVEASSSSKSKAVANREEDEAWERAKSEGVTAHLTGHASPASPRSDKARSEGYSTPREDEEAAWDFAGAQGLHSA